ncbi:MAG: hypothetical protein ACRDSG_07670 [Pseudonocardiaceae bacterium]
MSLAIIDVPYAATRRHLLAGEVPPLELDDLVAATCRFLLDEERVPGPEGPIGTGR